MQIQLRNVVPGFIEKEKTEGSQVWGQHIVINRNEHLHVVAPSGSGKTSFIHFIYGLRNDYSGDILYDNEEARKLSPEGFSSLRQNKISIIFQDLRLFPGRTARENLEIKRMLDPYHPEDAIDTMAERLGIRPTLGKPAKNCSYGEQQRIAIIRSLLQPFEFLLLDEPFSHLDDANRQKATKLIYEECEKRNAAMVFADLKELDFLKGENILML